MKYILFSSAILLIISCQKITDKDVKSSDQQVIDYHEDSNNIAIEFFDLDSVEHNSDETNHHKTQIIVSTKDTNEYSNSFIAELRKVEGMRSVELIDSLMILDKKDSITFPITPLLGEEMTFTSITDNIAIALFVERMNYTSVAYRIEITKFGGVSKTEKGIADLAPFFFLGSESDEDSQNGESYFSVEYVSRKDSCYTNIRIEEIGNPSDSPLRAKLIKNCNDPITDIGLDNFRTLLRKK